MKKKLPVLLYVLGVLVGLLLLLSPVFEKSWHTCHQSAAISRYSETANSLSKAAYDKLWSNASAYNSRLKTGTVGWTLGLYSEEAVAEYIYVLNVDVAEMMGYLEIPKLAVPFRFTTAPAMKFWKMAYVT